MELELACCLKAVDGDVLCFGSYLDSFNVRFGGDDDGGVKIRVGRGKNSGENDVIKLLFFVIILD